MTEPFGVGIIGAGTIAKVHAEAIGSLVEACVVAVADPREEAGRALAASHGADWHARSEALLARPDVDLAVLATPSGLHPDQAVLAARAGKHVITEKPMAITAEGIDRMIGACREARVTLSVIFQNRFTPDAVRLKRAVDAGLLGQPVLGGAVVHWRRTPAYYEGSGGWRGTWALDGGGALMNQAIHTVDLLQWLLGPVADVSAETATLAHRIEAEDTAAAVLRFASGALGVIQGTTTASKDWPVRVEVIGTAGRAVLEGGRLAVWEAERPADDTLLTPRDRELTAGAWPDEPFGAAHRRQLRAIFASLRAGEIPPLPGAEARKAVDIILAIYRSAASGERVAVSPSPLVPSEGARARA
jgi:UDP-N-acetyl-2-amino-2-deoxyglucuronate dehydrogenase